MVSKTKRKTYPDVSLLLASHKEYRRKLAALSWEEKVAIIERMRHSLYHWHQSGVTDDKRSRQRSRSAVR
ncbi:MAG: hypothetical protein L0312_22735 [Acidobacteria bacterium]|nr:hypothetical protein [Acidobacteriota bacterium]